MMDHRFKSLVRQHFLLSLTILTLTLSANGNLVAQTKDTPATTQKMTPTELQTFGRQIQEIVSSQNPDKFRALFDWKNVR